jgi:hypothetical protein
LGSSAPQACKNIIGCGAAMVLRPHQDGYYQFVGEAYLEGYNLGELYSELPDDALEEIGFGTSQLRKLSCDKVLNIVS